MVLLLAAALSASGGTVRRPAVGGTVVWRYAEPVRTASPWAALTFSEWQLVSLVHEGLYRLTAEGTPEAALASAAPDGAGTGPGPKRYTIRLRDARFHDGSRLAASDVAASFDAVQRGPTASLLDGITWRVTGSGAVVITTLLAPEALTRRLASPGLVIARASSPAVGLGAFRLVSLTSGGLTLTRHDRYHAGLPWLDGVVGAHAARVVGGTVGVAEDVVASGAHLTFEALAPLPGFVQVPVPAGESIGVVLSRSCLAAAARLVRARAPKSEIARRLPGTEVDGAAGPVEAGTPSGIRPYLGVADWLMGPIRDAFAFAEPWPLEPIGPERVLAAVQDGRPHDGVVVSWVAVVSPAAMARRYGGTYVPLVTRSRRASFSVRLRGTTFTSAGTLDLSRAFLIPATESGESP